MHTRGSEWRIWDLHVHTPASFENSFRFNDEAERRRYKGDIWAKYIDELEKCHHVAAIGVTDYFLPEGYRRVMQARRAGRLAGFQAVFPNIELRANHVTTDGRRLNIHLILSNEIEESQIDQLLTRVNLQLTTPNAQRPGRVGCTHDGLVRIGRSFEGDEMLPPEAAFKIGCRQAVVDVGELVDLLGQESGFAGKYLIVGVEDGPGGLSGLPYDQSGHLRCELYRLCDAIDSANPKTIAFWLGRADDMSPAELMSRFGRLKPCIHGSDAHTFERLCRPDAERYCWIKADTTFDGLRQILYEPQERIRIDSTNPEPAKSIYTLGSVAFRDADISTELRLEADEIPLNASLVAIVGGKGSGKTALLDMVANCFQDRRQGTGREGNSFIARVGTQCPDLWTSVSFIGEGVLPFSKAISKPDFVSFSEVTYLPQGAIEDRCGDQNELNRQIEDIVFGEAGVVEAGFARQMEDARIAISSAVKSIRKLNRDVDTLEQETSAETWSELTKNRGLKEGALRDRQVELSRLSEQLEAGARGRVEALTASQSELRSRLGFVFETQEALEKLKADLSLHSGRTNNEIALLNKRLRGLAVDVCIPEVSMAEQLRPIQMAIAAVAPLRESVTHELDAVEAQLKDLGGLEKQHADLCALMRRIEAELRETKVKEQDFGERRKRLRLLEAERLDEYVNLVTKHWETRQLYDQAIATFYLGRSAVLSNVEFLSSIRFDLSLFVGRAVPMFDLRKVNEKDLRRNGEQIASLLKSGHPPAREEVAKVIGRLLGRQSVLKGEHTSLDLADWAFGNYFNLDTTVRFRGKPLDKLSLGEKGMVLLKLTLAQGEHPLIVDQPEENLDNRYIFEELVPAIREAKKKRQILMATNNGNLVVNSDAEQVVMATFVDNVITYRAASLEDGATREAIIPVLEGGEAAFKQREQKYGF